MLKKRFICTDKRNVLYRIEQIKANDLPCGKSIFGGDLFSEGIHFKETGDKITGFYISESENESHRGSLIRVCFSGRFTEKQDALYFDVSVYPNIVETLILIVAFCCLSFFGKLTGAIIATVVLAFFAKGYYDMIKNVYHQLARIFN